MLKRYLQSKVGYSFPFWVLQCIVFIKSSQDVNLVRLILYTINLETTIYDKYEQPECCLLHQIIINEMLKILKTTKQSFENQGQYLCIYDESHFSLPITNKIFKGEVHVCAKASLALYEN